MRITGPRVPGFGPARTARLRSIVLLAAMAFAAVAAKTPETPVSVLSDLSASLSNSNPAGALSVFDHQMPGYASLERNLQALAEQCDVGSTIEIVTDDEEGGIHKLDLDWFMQVTSRGDSNQLERRRVRVKAEMRQIKGKWKITAIEPVSLFDPLRIR